MHRSSMMLPTVFVVAVAGSVILLLIATEVSWAWAPSQGSASEGPDQPSEPSFEFSTVIDNSSSERFAAPGWDAVSSGSSRYGKDYDAVKSANADGAKPARFGAKIPETGEYTVYAWWPAGKSNTAARFGISTASGIEWTEVDQSKDGGYWVKIGEYELEASDHRQSYVRVSPDSGEQGRIVADAVAIIRGAQANPPEDSYERDTSSGASYSLSSGSPRRSEVVRVARRHKGTPYGYSPCRNGVREDCSCHTRLVYKRFGRNLPDSPVRQWRNYGWRVARSDLRRGDLVFFKENGPSNPITHVAIYSGNGYVIHASNYFGRVAESEMKYINGYFGAKRLKLR